MSLNLDPVIENLPLFSLDDIARGIELSNSILNLTEDDTLASFVTSNFSKTIDFMPKMASYELLLASYPKPETLLDQETPDQWIKQTLENYEKYCCESTYLFLLSEVFSIWFIKSFYLQKRMIYELTHSSKFHFLGINTDFNYSDRQDGCFVFEYQK